MSISGVQKISTPLFRNPKEAWDEILGLAHSKGLQKAFEEEMLDRFDDATLQDKQICQQITAIFQADRFLNVFIKLASTYKSQYYSKDEISKILSLFLNFTKNISETNFSSPIEKVPHYDQGGQDWMSCCIKTLKVSNTSLKQLPSNKIKQLATPLVHRNLTKDLTKTLSLHRLFAQSSNKAHVDLVELLKKSGKIFSETDQVHLIQIILTLHSTYREGEEALLYWYKTVKETQSETTFVLVSNPPSFSSDKRADLHSTIRLLQWIVEIEDDAALHADLLAFYHQQISLTELLEILENIKREIETKKYPEKNIEEVLQAFASPREGSPGEGCLSALSHIELEKIAAQFAQIKALCQKLRKCDISELASKVDALRRGPSEDDKISLIAIGREAIRLKFKIYPYNTQILALLGILNHPTQFKGRNAQVLMGEGKSTIITLLAFYHACLGLNVDVIAPSRYLAERDQVKYHEFYQLFGISTSHICTDDPTEENFKGQIIFGTNSDFEFALMWDSIREKRLWKRPFCIALVDEVDNLFIDTALNSARISLPSQGKYGWVYQPILNFVKENLLLIFLRQNVTPSFEKSSPTFRWENLKTFLIP